MNPLENMVTLDRTTERQPAISRGAAPRHIHTSAPGRICLFGEHQDYLRLPVIAMAVDLRVEVEAQRRNDEWMMVELPDMGETLRILPNLPFAYRHHRDYLPAAANILRRHGVRWPHGYDVTIRGHIPINSGASSSSALQVAWSAFLLAAAGDPRAHVPDFVAHLAYEGEVPEFGAPGGMMDHYTSALGGIVYLDCQDPIHWQRYDAALGPFVLIDSGTPKDTNGVLGRVRGGIEAGLVQLGNGSREAVPAIATLEPADLVGLPEEPARVLAATLENRAITEQAHALLAQPEGDLAQRIGALLSRHHAALATGLQVSTPLIDSLLERAIGAGALGGKINGSGGGGSCFVLAPERAAAVCQLLGAEGFQTHTVHCGPGLQVEIIHD